MFFTKLGSVLEFSRRTEPIGERVRERGKGGQEKRDLLHMCLVHNAEKLEELWALLLPLTNEVSQ